jgi:peroxiredoxin
MPCLRRIGEVVLLGVVLVLVGGGLWGSLAETTSPGERPGLLAPGQPAPHFVAHSLDGQAVSLQEYHGRPVVLNFWATWCVPCRHEMPALQAVYELYKAAGLAILAVNQDAAGQGDVVRAFWTALGLTFLPLLDPEGRVAAPYNVFLLPSTVFVHPTGTIAAMHLGPMTQAQIERFLAAILVPPGAEAR